jgi:hypothetical protein
MVLFGATASMIFGNVIFVACVGAATTSTNTTTFTCNPSPVSTIDATALQRIYVSKYAVVTLSPNQKIQFPLEIVATGTGGYGCFQLEMVTHGKAVGLWRLPLYPVQPTQLGICGGNITGDVSIFQVLGG